MISIYKKRETIVWMLAFLLLAAVLCSACQTSTISASRSSAGTPVEKEKASTSYSPRQIAEIIIADAAAHSPDMPAVLLLDAEDPYYTYYLRDIYLLDTMQPLEGVVFYANGVFATEIAVFLFADDQAALAAQDILSRYKDQRENLFAGYAPEQARILEQGRVQTNGSYTTLLICPDAIRAEELFLACFRDDPPLWSEEMTIKETAEASPSSPDETGAGEAPPPDPGMPVDTVEEEANTEGKQTDPDKGAETEVLIGDALKKQEKPLSEPAGEVQQQDELPDGQQDEQPEGKRYDHRGILAAWFSGDASALADKDRTILDACADILSTHISSEMSTYEKELAIHDWMIHWADYDRQALSNAPDASPDPDNDNPYGLLLRQTAICSGYTSTFQLFMDMLGIECITVHGASGEEEHAWNMVCIDGQWYNVDVTWNDPVALIQTTEMKHRFFNVSSAFMKETRHQWDESTTPEANAAKLYQP